MQTVSELNLENQRVIIREDLNVPLEDGKITSDARILAVLPTIEKIRKQNARVIIMSHLGRPTESESALDSNAPFSLAPVAIALSRFLQSPVRLIQDWLTKPFDVEPGEVVLLENVRFEVGEGANDEALAKKMASLCDVFVMDAFAVAHRAQASTVGIAQFAKKAVAGPLLMAEIEALEKVMAKPERPLVAVVGGSKVSTKLDVLKSLINLVDTLVVGGGIANTFLAAQGYSVGKSLYEENLVLLAKSLMAQASAKGVSILIPEDVVVASALKSGIPTAIKMVSDIGAEDAVFDIGPKTQVRLKQCFSEAKTILWNGPVGVFEIAEFESGTKALSLAIAQSSAFSVAGGGDTLAAIDKYQIKDNISQISTGGGAFLEFVEGKVLPGVQVLQERGKD